jgi:ADP-ribose pyrophosphatase
MMIPLFDDGTVLMERQFRYPIGEVMLVPGGKRGRATLLASASCSEETGYTARRWDT